MRYEIKPSEPQDVAALDVGLRSLDRLELTCMGLTTRRGIWKSYRNSFLRKTAIVDGEIAAMFGCGGMPFGTVGHPWLLTTSRIERAPFAMLREGRKEVAAMLDLFPVLEGYVLAPYTQATRFLELLGFQLSRPFLYGPDKSPFRQYRMERA